MHVEDLNTIATPIDLSIRAAKKRQSPRTGLVHFFYGNESATDTIPLYENFCFVLALLHQKKVDAVLEAKDLLSRLLAFQTAEGNFPVYLHDFPKCFGFLLGLRILPLLLQITAHHPLLGCECKDKLEAAIARIVSFYENANRTIPPLWAYRFRMCKAVWMGESLPIHTLDTSQFSASDWWEYWVTKQFQEPPTCDFFHPGVGMCIGPFLFDRAHEGKRPSLTLIDWACGAKDALDHPSQIGLVALSQIDLRPYALDTIYSGLSSVFLASEQTGKINLLWKESSLHSLALETLNAKTPCIGDLSFQIHLPEVFELNRDDLFEAAFYLDAASDISLSVNGAKGTSFNLEDVIQIKSSNELISLRFALVDGQGDFCGHIFRSNRPNQRSALQDESFDWKIGLRTLRRSEKCTLSVQITASFL